MSIINCSSEIKTFELTCSSCGGVFSPHQLQTYAQCCNKPLLVKYNYDGLPKRAGIKKELQSMWRYQLVLPILNEKDIVSLSEGFTPIIKLAQVATSRGFNNVFIKDESFNPTGSFKARGISMAISKAKELGVKSCIIPTAGNAGGALSAYCAKAGMESTVIMPLWTPKMFVDECKIFGAEVILINGLINECGKKASEIAQQTGAFDISTLKEPYRIEGKKTMGYEIAEQFSWDLPDIIFYPAGGGTGLIGIWKAFKEMMQMGWIAGPLPKMVAVQSENCQPVVKAYHDQESIQNTYKYPKASIANGLAVPYPFGLDLMLNVLKESGGLAIAVSEQEILDGLKELARSEGLLVSPEGASLWKAMVKLKKDGVLTGDEKIVLLNTGSAYKYFDNIFS